MANRAHQVIVGLVSLALAARCREPTRPAPALLDVAVAQSQVSATRSGASGSFAVDVTLRNESSSAIRVYSCGPIAERQLSPDRWGIAIEYFCALASVALEVPPHGAVTRTETLIGSLSGTTVPSFPNGVIAGRYRLLYRYAGVEETGQLSEARSVAFDVVE